MTAVRQFLLAVSLSILGLTVLAQTVDISGNLVLVPNHLTRNGQTVAQTYAINQALSAAGAGVMIHGFNYGYQYNLGSSYSECTAFNQNGSCSWTMTFTPRVDVGVNIRSNTNTTIFSTTHTETGTNTGNRSRDFEYRFVSPRDIATLGNFGFSASTASGNSSIWGMYSRAVYTVDPCVSNPQSSPSCPGYKTYYNISDDDYAIVPIPFGFPFYGKLFTHSIFFDNGTVSFYTPNQEPQRWGAGNTGGTIGNNMGSQFYYSIMPLWTDLINYNGAHYTQGNSNHLRYTWENVSEFGNPSSSNTFSVEIRPTGFVGIQYGQIDVSRATRGMVGNAALGEFATINSQTSWSVNQTVAADCSNPLVNVNCPGYAQAFLAQQCSANPLYSTTCPGYAQAFLTQQCSANTLYSVSCPGYAVAYYDYQCSVDPLYHTGCPGHAAAYFDQQCSLDALYNNQCPGYADAYYIQQCNINALYDSGCTGYDVAYQAQQCSIDALYNNQCPGYAQAYAKKYILTSNTTSQLVAVLEIKSTEELTPVEVSAALAPAASVGPADSATAPVQLISTPVAVASATTTSATAAEPAAPPARTTRQALAERRMAAAQAAAAQSARDNAGAVSEQMDSAASMEQQVELQNVVLGAMGFVAGFDAYGRVALQDAVGYRPFEIYRGQQNVDSTAARGLLGRSDRIHQDMVDSQYNK